jgi:hypothetical protein
MKCFGGIFRRDERDFGFNIWKIERLTACDALDVEKCQKVVDG